MKQSHLLVIEDDPAVRELLENCLTNQSHRVSAVATGEEGLRLIEEDRPQLVILDLARHKFERAHALYGDQWLGFAESDLHRWLETAGFKKIEISVVAREEQPPHFETLLAGGHKQD